MRAPEVERFDDVLRRQVDEMTSLMERADGAGLAAPQIGMANRVFVCRIDAELPALAVVNPVIEEHSDDTGVELEGCLSLGRASVQVAVERPRSVLVTAQELDGSPLRIEAADRLARVLQHEIDHLDGVLMLARIDPVQRRSAVRALLERKPWSPPWWPVTPDAPSG